MSTTDHLERQGAGVHCKFTDWRGRKVLREAAVREGRGGWGEWQEGKAQRL